MSRTYMSVLGTTNYTPCRYYLGTKEAATEPIRFVQEATIRFACQGWGKDDRIIIFTTDLARETNWVDDGHLDPETKQALACKGLEGCLAALDLACEVKAVPIPDGKDVPEIWTMFQHIERCVPDRGDVVFDITHGFRSLPMLAVVALNYGKAVKKINVAGIYYGALEALGEPRQIKSMPEKDRFVPILDLTAFDVLMDWTAAVDRFVVSGDAHHAADLARRGVTPILSATKGRDETAASVRDMAESLRAFCKAVATCRGRDIATRALRVKQSFNEYRPSTASAAFDPLVSRIEDAFGCFQGFDIADGIQAARWCHEYGLIQQGYTILLETLVTAVVGLMAQDPLDETVRGAVSGAASLIAQGKKDTLGNEDEKASLFGKALEFFSENPSCARLVSDLAKYRNDLNHAGWRRDMISSDKFEKKLQEFIDRAAKDPAITKALES